MARVRYNRGKSKTGKNTASAAGPLDRGNACGHLITGDLSPANRQRTAESVNWPRGLHSNASAHFHPCTPALAHVDTTVFRFKGPGVTAYALWHQQALKPWVLRQRCGISTQSTANGRDYRSHSSPQPWRSSRPQPFDYDIKL